MVFLTCVSCFHCPAVIERPQSREIAKNERWRGSDPVWAVIPSGGPSLCRVEGPNSEQLAAKFMQQRSRSFSILSVSRTKKVPTSDWPPWIMLFFCESLLPLTCKEQYDCSIYLNGEWEGGNKSLFFYSPPLGLPQKGKNQFSGKLGIQCHWKSKRCTLK